MSEEKEQPGVDLGIDGAERESEFDRLAGEAGAGLGPVQPTQPAQPETYEIIEPILEMGFGILAPAWQVSGAECRELSKAYGALIDKYFPEGMGNYGVEVSAVMITAAVILPRMKLPRKVEAQPVEGSGNEQ